jgi:hypothetical protein
VDEVDEVEVEWPRMEDMYFSDDDDIQDNTGHCLSTNLCFTICFSLFWTSTNFMLFNIQYWDNIYFMY